ncbi:hypothetical protein F1880_007094 [Penicillium rolfsii]|nr:hypothetical protein F1880_007094 [Penicillium rolfsii]
MKTSGVDAAPTGGGGVDRPYDGKDLLGEDRNETMAGDRRSKVTSVLLITPTKLNVTRRKYPF